HLHGARRQQDAPKDHMSCPRTCYKNSTTHQIYMDYNATTPLDPEVIMAITEALKDAWGNPSSTYLPAAVSSY
uniref:Selenocysteine lyase n=1 Tax=Paramormyrops kingsleyae TaxID=1676925 RepID=A0A3B3RXR8_9TELE